MTRPSFAWRHVVMAIGSVIACPHDVDADNPVSPKAAETLDLYGDPVPKGAVARLGTTRFRAGSDWMRGLALTPDGSALIAATEGHAVYVWSTATGRLIRKIRTDPLNIRGFALSRDGKQVAVAGFYRTEDLTSVQSEVRIMDVNSGELIRAFPRLDRSLDHHAMAFTPDGKLLISLGTAGILRVEEVDTGTEVLQREFTADNSPEIALSPDGSLLAICCGLNARKFYLWRWQAGEEPREIRTYGAPGGGHLAFSPDGQLLAACQLGVDRPLQVWEVNTGRLVMHWGKPEQKRHLWGTPVFSPDGAQLLVPGHGYHSSQISLFQMEIKTGEYVRSLDGLSRPLIAFSSDGRLLAAPSHSGVRVWKWPSLEEILPNDTGHHGSVSQIAATTRDRIITASDDGTIRVWDGATSKQLAVMRHDYWVRDIAVSLDGAKLVSSSLDNTIRLWDLTAAKEIYRLPGHGRLGGARLVEFSSDGRNFRSFGDDMFLRTWDVRTGKALAEHKIRPTGVQIPEEGSEADPFSEFSPPSRAAFSTDASVFALAFKNHHVFDAETGKELLEIAHPGSYATGLAISPDKRFLLAAAWGKPEQVPLADGRTLFTTERQNLVSLWDLGTGQLIRPLVLPQINVGPAAFSADGQRFAVAMTHPTNRIAIYDTATSQEVHTIEDVPARVSALCFAREDKTIVAGLADSTAVIWDLSASIGKP